MRLGFPEVGPSSPRRYLSSRLRWASENGAASGILSSGRGWSDRIRGGRLISKHDRQGSQTSQAEVVPPHQGLRLER